MLPFSVFPRAGRPYYYVAFKNLETGGYLPAISTKKKKEDDAIRIAWEWYREGIPGKNGAVDLKVRSFRDFIRHSDISSADAAFIVDDLKRRGLVVSCVFAGASDAVLLGDFLREFWDWERSPYIREKLRAEHSIHKRYVNQMAGAVKQYWIYFFPSALLGELLPRNLESFIEYISDIRQGKEKMPLSAVRKNMIIKAGTIPLRWAFRKNKIAHDITSGLMFFSGKSSERKILTPELASAIFAQDWNDERSRVANMTAMVTGLRAGELQGLRVSDLGEASLLVQHSWNRLDKLKGTKNNEARIVELPFPSVLQALRYVAELNPHGFNANSYVFWSSKLATKPMEQRIFLDGLRAALVACGLTEAQAAEYDFHAWRHFYTAYMQDKIEDKLLQKQTGHKTLKMLRRYGDHLLPGDRTKIREAQVEVFSALLPDN